MVRYRSERRIEQEKNMENLFDVLKTALDLPPFYTSIDLIIEIARRVLCFIILVINAAMVPCVFEWHPQNEIRPRLGKVPPLP